MKIYEKNGSLNRKP